MSAAIRPAPVNQSFGNSIAAQTGVAAGQKQLQPHPAGAGAASQLPASLKRKQSQSAALQNTDDETQDESSPSASAPRARARDKPKKKKASRACVHCQKAHLTCDDARPCQRCVKRGIAANCTEGHRKKAKYLLDEEELEKLKSRRGKSSSAPEPSVEPSPVQPAAAPPPSHVPPAPTQPPFDPNDQMFNPVPFDPSFPFGSEAANLEYSILSAILGNPSPPETTTSPDTTATPYSSWPADDPMEFAAARGSTEFAATFPDPQIVVQPSDTTISTSPTTRFLTYAYPQPQEQQEPLPYAAAQFSPQEPHPLQPRFPLENRPRSPHFSAKDTAALQRGSVLLSPSQSSGSPFAANAPEQQGGSQLQNINDRVTMPYDYTEGYHFLMKHLPTRCVPQISPPAYILKSCFGTRALMFFPPLFEKNDILRIVRALAIFRPSLIALQMPLSFDDEVFVEKCFQRSLLPSMASLNSSVHSIDCVQTILIWPQELDKLISFSGTPTVVWRRTGEICLVAPEFCMLTEWSLDELVGRKKYIYEVRLSPSLPPSLRAFLLSLTSSNEQQLFENQSVVEYWENFAAHAFENTTQSVYSHCVLLKPNGAPVPSTFCLSIRRDLFDLPSVVIGVLLSLSPPPPFPWFIIRSLLITID
ncbi:Transcriptional factor [Mycena sanguinolenta]|uniref:Transcription activator of gluconeogenesis ERT1 n=1 Tax=Mycena sanguinolenta TaxID=230812 RepID=A0A8H6ZCD3_9AGAR|nr:Transcriptional factor [Mycena sanguinolenta]